MRGMVEALRRVEDVVGKSGGAFTDTVRSTGRKTPTTTWSSSCASSGSRLSGTAPATSIGCTSTTRQAPPSLALEQQAKGVFNIVDDLKVGLAAVSRRKCRAEAADAAAVS